MNFRYSFAQTLLLFLVLSPLPAGAESLGESSSASGFLFGQENPWDATYKKTQGLKEKFNIPISVGAQNWWHVDRNNFVYGDGYGVPNLRGTYYYYAAADPSLKIENEWVSELGGRVEGRFRDTDDKLRAFYASTIWFYEAYAYVKTPIGRFKGGQIVTNFGIPWDGTWWEGTPYFDGYKFDPDYGISWDHQWKVNEVLRMDASAQFFFISNDINGSLVGADAESAANLNERNTGVGRLLTTWQARENFSLAWGVSALVGGIEGSAPGTDSSRGAWGMDLRMTSGNFSIFGEFIDGYGAANPVRYVSGGPSDHIQSLRFGAAYRYGPATFRMNISQGWDHNPDGSQYIFDTGVTVQLMENVTLYAEYVKWNVTNSQDVTSKFNDGFELVLAWNY